MATQDSSSLYERLGGVYSIATVVDDFATCCLPPGSREAPTFLAVSIGRRESRPSCWLGWGVFSPSVVFAKDRSSRHFFVHARYADTSKSEPSAPPLSTIMLSWLCSDGPNRGVDSSG